jgi:TubC N-terminal docking domain
MNAKTLIAEAARRGIELIPEVTGNLRYRGPKGAMTADLLASLRREKSEVFALIGTEGQQLVRTYSKILDAEFWIVKDDATRLRLKASLDPDARPVLTAEEAALFAQMAQEDARELFRATLRVNDMLGRTLVLARAMSLMKHVDRNFDA